VPTGGNVIARIAPLLGIEPRFDLPPSDRLILAASRTTQLRNVRLKLGDGMIARSGNRFFPKDHAQNKGITL